MNSLPVTRPLDGIRLVLLDLGGVVFQTAGTSNERVDWAVIGTLNERYGHALNVGEDKFPDFLRDYNRLTGQALSGQTFLTAVFDTLSCNYELIEMLAARFRIAIVSDNYRENIAYIANRYDFAAWATHQVYSFDYQMVKADAAFFPRLLQEFPAYTAEEMLLIDDSPDKLASASRCGIRGLLYEGNGAVRTVLT